MPLVCNAEMGPAEVRECCTLDEGDSGDSRKREKTGVIADDLVRRFRLWHHLEDGSVAASGS